MSVEMQASFNWGSQILRPSPVSFQRKRVIFLHLYQQGISEAELEPHCASERTCYSTEWETGRKKKDMKKAENVGKQKGLLGFYFYKCNLKGQFI